ncbi:MAG: type II toxin-antitoxin system HicB family antitoxin [Oscillospiraceae bacterium]|jgi:predicted RNase H-like HicB family nuclease|nr:type II toxin-antitoxin system HicB family antitoxin [Oscillospiraceae bacterium]
MKYVYAAVFEAADEGGYAVSFPDLPGCYSQGDDLCEAISMAHSALRQWIEYLTDKKQPIPQASDIKSVATSQNGFVNLICVDVKDGRAVKRTISIPKWMDDKVSETGLSLSRVLQDALAERLQ